MIFLGFVTAFEDGEAAVDFLGDEVLFLLQAGDFIFRFFDDEALGCCGLEIFALLGCEELAELFGFGGVGFDFGFGWHGVLSFGFV